MKITSIYQKIFDMLKSTEEKQKDLSVGEVSHLSTHLTIRYGILETTNVLKNFTKDGDLRLIIDIGVKVIEGQVTILEKLMKEYSVYMPSRPPFDVKTSANIELISDRHIFRIVFRGIQSMIPFHAQAYTESTNSALREQFKSFLIEEIELFDGLREYGKIKGYEFVPPRYKV